MTGSWRDRAAVLASALLAVVLLGPALGPGYVLQADLVFVPRQDLLPWMLGLGGSLPRAVPQDLVVSALTVLAPGWVWQDLALLGGLVLLGSGVGRLVRPAGRRAALAASVVAVWSPYVGERLLLGHWSLLLAVGLLPWALVHARAAREGAVGARWRWVLVAALASLTPTGGLLVLVVSLPVLLWRGGAPLPARTLTAGAGAVLQLPWLVPALLHPGAADASGTPVFALRPEGPWGALMTALGTGGVWNAGAVPGSRGSWLAPLLTAALLALAWWGRRPVARALGRPVLLVLVSTSALGLVLAVAAAWWPEGSTWAVGHVPGAGLLRDGQKLLAPWLVLLAGAAGCGAARASWAVARRSGDAVAGGAVLVAVLVLPLACVPDLAWGSGGRLGAVDYPDDWGAVRAALAEDPAPGDVVALPWSTFRRFPWNRGRTVLDPAPRFLTRTVIADQDLVVRHDGALVVVPGDDPRAARVGRALVSADPAAALRAEGIGWAVVEAVEGEASAEPPAGAVRVAGGPTVALYRLPAPGPAPAVTGAAAVVAGNLAALLVVVLSAAGLARARFRHGGPARLSPEATGW